MRGFFSIRRKRIVAFFLVLMLLASGFTVSAAGNGTSSDRQTIQEQSAAGSSEMEDSGTEPQSAVTQPAGNEEDTEEKTTKDNTKDNGDTKVVSVLSVDELAEETVISSDEKTGIEQLANIIPDRNFRTEVWRSLSVAGQLGDPDDPQYEGLEGDELYKAVLGNFTGKVYASGYVKEVRYTYTFLYKMFESDSEYLPFYDPSSYEDRESALAAMEERIQACIDRGLIVDESSASVTGSLVITEEKKPDDQLIEDITGIIWLRKAEEIDVSFNRITSLMPMDINGLDQDILKADPELKDGRAWFGERFRNVVFEFSGNPLSEFPSEMPGRIRLATNFSEGDIAIEEHPLILIKEPEGNPWPIELTIDMPELFLDGKALQYTQSTVWASGLESLGAGADDFEYVSDDPEHSGTIIVEGVKHSGSVGFGASIRENLIAWYVSTQNTPGEGEGENINIDYTSLSVRLSKDIRIYYDVYPGNPVTKISVDFTKTGLNSAEPVANAEYGLFRMKTDADGNLIYRDTDQIEIRDDGAAYNQDGTEIAVPLSEHTYETDADGKFTITEEELEPGWYCFIETDSPEGYELDTTPLQFEVGSASVEITGGTDLTDMEFEKIGSGSSESPAGHSYQLYYETDEGEFVLYNDDSDKMYVTDENGKFSIKGLPDGTYQLREVNAAGRDQTAQGIEFKVEEDIDEIEIAGEAKISFERVKYFDHISPADITLTPDREDMQLQSVIVSWHDFAGNEKSTSFDTVEEAEEFINSGNEDVFSQIYVQPVYLQTGEIRAEDPAKVQFSFVKTDGDPGKSLSGAEFTLYKADENWQWSEDVVYKTAVSAEQTGLVDFGYLDSGNYIMKETAPPPGYAALPGYWKITADAWAQEGEPKLTFTYVREDKTETKVSEDTIIPKDIYGNRYYIPNYPVDSLPSMGGNGTRIFTVFGLVFTGAALILFTCARRYKKIKGV